jgi:hypothetical protein
MGLFNKKSKHESEIEREISYRKAKAVVNNYIGDCESIKKRYWEQGIEAARTGDEEMLKRFAAGYFAMVEGSDVKDLAATQAELDKTIMNSALSAAFDMTNETLIKSSESDMNLDNIVKTMERMIMHRKKGACDFAVFLLAGKFQGKRSFTGSYLPPNI